MRKNQKGFTLVELIIAVAILAIVTAAVCGFIVVGSRSYASSNTDIMLQQDAQLALNQMSDVIIDTTDSISYGLSTSGSSDMKLVLKDSEFAGEATEKCLIVVNRQEAGSNNDNPSYWFYWSKDDEIIYFNEVEAHSSIMTPEQVENEFKNAESGKAILAQHVTDFSIDISQFEANRVVMISMTFENGNRTYSTSNNVTVRNRIALNEITVGPLKRAEDFEINAVRNITMEPGESLYLRGADLRGNTIVEVNTSGDDELTWEIIGAPTDSTLGDDGHLTIGQGEISQNFSVKVSRKNEEYAGQNDRVAQTIKVNVKRATSVAINGPTTAKQGETVDLTARAEGNLLTQPCNGCVVSDAALAMDRDVDGWDVEGDAEIKTSDSGSASVFIHSTAKVGDTITVKAYSKLSWDKNYGPKTDPKNRPIWGVWEITVTQGSDIKELPGSGGFKFGTNNDDSANMTYDFIFEDAKMSNYHKYVVCARIRELDASTCDNDQVILYYSGDGKNVRFNPDIFGVNHNRSYHVYIQVLLPVDKSQYENVPNKNAVDFGEDADSVIAAEYIANLDSTGKYIGTKYEASPFYYGLLSPPFLSVECNGVTYPTDDSDYSEVYHLTSNNTVVIDKINFGNLLNIREETLNEYHNVKFSIYKDGELVAGYDPTNTDRLNDVFKSTTFGGGVFRISTQGSGKPMLAGSNYLTRDTNNKNWDEAVGTYEIVPGFWYANKEGLGGYHIIYYDNLNGDYGYHFYQQFESTITLKVDTGLNMKLPNDDISIENSKERWTNFPLPIESDFPFELKSDTPQTISRTLQIYSASGKELTQDSELSERFRKLRWPGATITCVYDSSTGKYTLTVATEIIEGRKVTTHVFGVYAWQRGDAVWNPVNIVESENTTTINTNIKITKADGTYETYFPAPSEGGFTYESKAKTTSYRLLMFKNNGSTSYETITATYQMVNGKYQVTFTRVERQGRKRTTYTYGPLTYTGSDWGSCTEKIEYEAIWDYDSLATFTYSDNKVYKMELPNPPGYSTYTDKPSVIYAESDTFGETEVYTYGGLAIDYTYDSNTGTYTARFRNGNWDDGKTSYAIYTYNKDTKKWVKTQ